jgi:hypothetical protein
MTGGYRPVDGHLPPAGGGLAFGAMAPVSVSPTDDADRAGEVLAAAFADDPVMRWMFPHLTDRSELRPWFTLAARVGVRRAATWLLADDGEPAAAAVWTPPGHSGAFDEESVDELVAVSHAVGGDDTIARMRSMGALMAEHHPPDEPHWYLFLAGVRPGHQGLGRASARRCSARCWRRPTNTTSAATWRPRAPAACPSTVVWASP